MLFLAHSPTDFSKIGYAVFTHWRQCACVHFLSAITDHKQAEGAWSL